MVLNKYLNMNVLINTDSQLNPYEWAMFNDFKLYNVNTENAEIEKWSIPSTKVGYFDFNKKTITDKDSKIQPN